MEPRSKERSLDIYCPAVFLSNNWDWPLHSRPLFPPENLASLLYGEQSAPPEWLARKNGGISYVTTDFGLRARAKTEERGQPQ